MKIDFKTNTEEENPTLSKHPTPSTEIKTFLVEYTGDKLSPEGANVTVEMIIEVLSDEFPELVMALAEENWVRGYKQAFVDIEATTEALKNFEETDE